MPSLGPWSCTSESCRNRSLPMSSIPILQAASVRYWLWGFPTHKQFELLYLQEMYKQLYLSLPSSAALSDSVAKESCMLNLLLSLPEPNLVTFLFLLDHLKRYKQLNTKINAQKVDMTAHQCAQKERQTKFKNVNFYSWCIRWWSLTSVFSDGFSLHLSPTVYCVMWTSLWCSVHLSDFLYWCSFYTVRYKSLATANSLTVHWIELEIYYFYF